MIKLRDFTKEFSSRDPDVICYNGLYYACAASNNDSISILCADRIEGLMTAMPKKVYSSEPGKPYSKQLWAPELHVLDGKCYIYVACDDGDNHNHRMYVLENGSSDPMDPYTMHGKISDSTDKWAIDGTVIHWNGKRYFVWSGWEGDTNICQNLYIAEMKSPYELCSKRFLISTPEYDFEKLGATGEEESPFINEGPYGVVIDGELYITYSGAGSWCEDYCITVLKLVGENPLDKGAWEKFDAPIFTGNDLVKGAGHCSVVTDAKGMHVFFQAWEKDETVIEWNRVATWQGEVRLDGGKLIIE